MKQLIFKIAFTVLSVILFYGCSTEPYDWGTTTTLEVITGECTDIQYNYAKVNMEIIDSSGESRIGGICYSKNENPSIENNDPYIQYDVLLGKQEIEIYDLTQNTKYYYRAFIFDNSPTKIIYGDVKYFTTPKSEYITSGTYDVGTAVYSFRSNGRVWYTNNQNQDITSVTIPEKSPLKD